MIDDERRGMAGLRTGAAERVYLIFTLTSIWCTRPVDPVHSPPSRLPLAGEGRPVITVQGPVERGCVC